MITTLLLSAWNPPPSAFTEPSYFVEHLLWKNTNADRDIELQQYSNTYEYRLTRVLWGIIWANPQTESPGLGLSLWLELGGGGTCSLSLDVPVRDSFSG